ncbi:MAG: single-stranded-DNA-specific exonuclease RecJ [Lachnospiraceae bacterium]|nr:single-stranded-DNA-specific exonuclease RecJ [Lachnospiraceae bacterium]
MQEMVQKLEITPAFARILCGRGYDTVDKAAAFLYPDGAELTDAKALPDAERFCAFLRKAKAERTKVRVIGDYDADGVTAVFLMITGLRRFGIEADYRIPNRVTDGYGISPEMVREVKEDGVGMLITVDNGIAQTEAARLAKSLGMAFLITDHHEPQEELPEADAIVDFKCNPNYPGSAVCGAVVAGKLMDLLLASEGMPGFFSEHIEILALATVADVMELTGENRIIVKKGLSKPIGYWNLGLRKLAAANGLKTEPKAYTLGFVFAPCINALGRLGVADPGVELLLETDETKAEKLATDMVDANRARKDMTKEALDDAIAYLDALEVPEKAPIVYYSGKCHESIAGIVAGKIRERYYLPTIVLCNSDSEELLKGSGRSIPGYSIFEGLTSAKDCLVKFGGHSQACGLSIKESDLPEFRRRLSEHFKTAEADTEEKISVDLVVTFSDLTEAFLSELGRAEPFGTGNPKPILAARNVTLTRISHFGKSVRYTRLHLQDEQGSRITGVWFGNADEFVKELTEKYGKQAVSDAYAGRGTVKMHILFFAKISSYSHEAELEIGNYRLI